ncbi:hypothetical protein LJB86_01130 [Deltaproteobacteria bacterium OttesenSCG-928-M10]|nr:hypothetical protein [Deltaproteobacteria bacterium OttesenSCG-928-M10]
MPRFASVLRLTTLTLVLFCLAACDKGPFSPEARRQSAALDQYVKMLQANLVVDDTFEWNTLSSALIVRVLPYNQEVSRAADLRFASDKTFHTETAAWDRAPGRKARPPVTILLGLFTQDLKAKDVMEMERFRPRLKTAGGRILEPLEIKRYGRDHVFIRDHFPIFNPWEDVYLVKFQGPSRSADTYDRQEFLLEWPGGTQTLILNSGPR